MVVALIKILIIVSLVLYAAVFMSFLESLRDKKPFSRRAVIGALVLMTELMLAILHFLNKYPLT